MPGNVTSKQSWTPNTLIKQGAQLTATWEDVWETLPSQVRLELEAGWGLPSQAGVESKSDNGTSDLPDHSNRDWTRERETPLRGREAIVFNVLRQDAALQMDEILDLVESQLSSAEVFTALFELELAGRIRSLPGKNYVRPF